MTQKLKKMQKCDLKIWNLIKEKPLETALSVLLVIQAGLIMFSNLALLDRELDFDSAMLLRHVIEMARERTLTISDWSYITTLEWDCTTLFALPLYLLTNDIFLSCAMSNTIFLGIMVAVLFFLFSGEKKIYPLFCINLIVIPYRIGQLDYFNMLFFSGAQYIVKVLVPLILVGILMNKEQESRNKNVWAERGFTALYVFLLLLSSMSSSLYVVACGVVPIWAAYIGYKFFRWEKVQKRVFILLGVSMVCAIVGLWVNNAIAGGSKATEMTFCSTQSLLTNVSACFFGLFELMGGSTPATDVTVFSFWGIVRLGKIFLVLAALTLGGVAVAKCLRKQGNLRLLLLISIFAWNYLILNIINANYNARTYEYRYHLIGMLPLICVMVIEVVEGINKMNLHQRRMLSIGVFLIVTALAWASFRELFMREERNADRKEIVQYFEGTDLEVIYMFCDGNTAEVCRLFDDDQVYLELREDGTTRAYDFYSRYHNNLMQTENAVVLATPEMGDSFLIGDITVVKFGTVAGHNLYYFAME